MSPTLLAILVTVIVSVIILIAVAASSQASSIARVVLALALLPVAGFCAFGFLAAGEPGDRAVQLAFRLAYGGIGLISLSGSIYLFLPKKKKDNTPS